MKDLIRKKEKKGLMENNNLADWVFHFNIHTQNWEAAKREHYVYLFSNRVPEYVIKSKKISVLVELINLYDDAETINKSY